MRASSSRQNFHVPLSPRVYRMLRGEAERSKRPATEVAREAIEACLEQRERARLRDEIAAYAVANGGTTADLDRELEQASVEHLLEVVEESK